MASLRDLPKIERIIRDDDGPQFVVLPFGRYKKFIAALELEGAIDEAAYLKAHPDVGKAIETHRVRSATEHYKASGYVEMRRARILP